MKLSYIVDENNIVTWWGFPLIEGLPTIEVISPEADIHVGYSKIIDGELISNTEAYNTACAERAAEANARFLANLKKN